MARFARDCCCCGCGSAFTSVFGFVQLCLAVLLVFLASGPTLLNPHGECTLGEGHKLEALCSGLGTLSALTIFSGLILSVSQGFLSVACLAPCGRGGCVETSGRGALAAAWMVTATLGTVHGAKGDAFYAPSAGWFWVTVALCWVMFTLSLGMAITAFARYALDCLNPSAYGHQSCLALCAEVLCLAWLLRWLTGSRDSSGGPTEGYTLYTPMPGGPSQAPPTISHSRHPLRPSPPSPSGYHEHLMHAHVPVTVVHPVNEPSQSSFYGPTGGSGSVPMQRAAPVYPTFQPSMPSVFGQGVPAMGVPVAPQHQQYPPIHPPSHPHMSSYPPSGPQTPEGYGKAEPSAPPMPPSK